MKLRGTATAFGSVPGAVGRDALCRVLRSGARGAFGVALAVALVGCRQFEARSQAPESEPAADADSRRRAIGDVANVVGLQPVAVEGVGLVVGLDGTGSDPPPSLWRTSLLEDMKRRKVNNPNAVLASPATSLVLVRGYLRPGVAKGDAFDVEVRVPHASQTTSVRGGWLLETYLSEGAVIRGVYMGGRVMAKASGPIMVAPIEADESADTSLLRQGRILGGGTSVIDRRLGLVLRKRFQTAPAAIRVAGQINQRFAIFQRGARQKQGTATPKDNKHIELRIAPRYRLNLARYLAVVRQLPYDSESVVDRDQRIERLSHSLLDPATASRAALQLEGIGADAVPALEQALETSDPTVRFHAAEALAYLGETSCARPLQEAASREPAHRVWALTALTSLDEAISHQMLHELMDGESAETRYGAFRALWALDEHDPFIRGQRLADQFYLHVLDTRGDPMVHVTRSFRPEIVLFGTEQKLKPPFLLKAGRDLLVNASAGSEEVHFSRFRVGERDRRKVSSLELAEVIRTAARMGATYPDVVWMLYQAQQQGALPGRVEVDALPRGNRRRTQDPDRQDDTSPNLFPVDHLGSDPADRQRPAKPVADAAPPGGGAAAAAQKATASDPPTAEPTPPQPRKTGFFANLFRSPEEN
ncbi:MAG: flagellar basal body P-ring protein FlgI [Pirellulales bacterium]